MKNKMEEADTEQVHGYRYLGVVCRLFRVIPVLLATQFSLFGLKKKNIPVTITCIRTHRQILSSKNHAQTVVYI